VRFPPASYAGPDYYVDQFTDAKIKEAWGTCRSDPACLVRVLDGMSMLDVPHQFRMTGSVDAQGRIDPHGEVDLKSVRRPGFFGQAPYREPIAERDDRAYVVEFTAPREAYERIHLQRVDPIKLRGWYLVGDGVDDGAGNKIRAVMMLIAGRSIETTAIQHPDDHIYRHDEATGKWIAVGYPGEKSRTEMWGARSWRHYINEMNRAGFDVLTFDKRGHGISGGLNDSNMGEQAEDAFRALDALETGAGLRLAAPGGDVLSEGDAAGLLLAGQPARAIPVIIGGPSQGSMVTSWAMQKNFVENCSYDLPEVVCAPPHRYNVKGAILLASFAAGVGFRSAPDAALVEAATRVELNVQAGPTSEILANIDKWPAVFIGRGLWDFGESLEGAFETYRRARGLKEIVVVRGPHGENEWGEANADFVRARMKVFAMAAILGLAEAEGAAKPQTLRELVASSPKHWEETSAPRKS
jgi:pimeloyl-ACP methyl ester carboxylesterase